MNWQQMNWDGIDTDEAERRIDDWARDDRQKSVQAVANDHDAIPREVIARH